MVGTDYTITAQSEFAKMMSFFEIGIGYVLAIFATSCPASQFCQLIIVVIASAVLFMLNKVALYFVKKKFEKLHKEKPQNTNQ